MVSNQEKAARRRRTEKAQERYDRAMERRKRQRTIAWILIGAFIVIAAAAIVLVIQVNKADPPGQDTTASVPSPDVAEGRAWTATITTSVGDIVVELDGAAAPQAVASFLTLAQDGFYDGTSCHRLLPDSLLQCGDPTGTGTGGPGYTFGPIENAPADDVYPAGTLAMARVGNDAQSQGSQFFLVFGEVTLPSDSAGGYTVFGTVTQGLDILQSVGAAGTTTGTSDGPPATAVTIEKVTIA